MVTHDREMVDKMRKRVIALEDGRLARDERRGGYDANEAAAALRRVVAVALAAMSRRRSRRR